MPDTFVLAAQDHGNNRDVFYIRLNGFFQDGLWLPYAKRLDDRSVVEDAMTLGPRGSIKRKPSRADRREFKKWAAIIANQWREWAVNNSPCEQYRSRWQSLVDRFTRAPNAASVALNSETEIDLFGNGYGGPYQYARELWFHPTIPNSIQPDSLGARQILGFARVVPRIQADAGLHQWSQRVWYIDHAGDKEYIDGRSPRDDYGGYVNLLTIRPGLLSQAFDGRDLRPIEQHELGALLTHKKLWIEQHGAKHAAH
ncbi:MAG: hypothetical protein DWQ37_05385 [Planctomycetota bacterium]|nr:MAG: hypothetical protein DWQ37_05385 [Planctomycetota bacterium]